MKKLLLTLDARITGIAAAMCAGIAAVILVVVTLRPLPWNHFPNVFKIFMGSWLYLVIAGALMASALQAVAKRKQFPTEMVVCLAIGMAWKYTPWFRYVPFNISHFLIIYGLAGLSAHFLRRAVTRRTLEPRPVTLKT